MKKQFFSDKIRMKARLFDFALAGSEAVTEDQKELQAMNRNGPWNDSIHAGVLIHALNNTGDKL